jgi:hypothetical protein
MVENGARQAETESLRPRQRPQNRLGVLCWVWKYQYIVDVKIWHMPTFGLIDRNEKKNYLWNQMECVESQNIHIPS